MEALTAVVFVAVAVVRGVDARLLLELPFAAMLIAVAAIDLERQVIPNKILLPAAVYGVGRRRRDRDRRAARAPDRGWRGVPRRCCSSRSRTPPGWAWAT